MKEETRKKMTESFRDAFREDRLRFPKGVELSFASREDLDPGLFETEIWKEYADSIECPSVEQSRALLDLFEANIQWVDTAVDIEGNEYPMDGEWRMNWPFGTMAITPRKDHGDWAIRIAARFAYLWLCGVKAWTADHLAHFESTWLQILEEEREEEEV